MASKAVNTLRIWVDADACPTAIREILVRAAIREKVETTFVANQFIPVQRSEYVKAIQVASGFDVADNEIVQRVSPGDLVITSDIPLAAEVIEKSATALNARGERYTRHNIRSRLNMRDFMDTLRGSGIQSGGPPAFSQKDRQNFANQLDGLLAKRRL